MKSTKTARESARIAASKIDRALAKLADMRRTVDQPSDARIYPGSYAPVLIWESGRIVVRPMRYGCRPAGKPAFYDAKFPGTYNARRDNLEGFWKGQFGRTHGVMLASAFYENVARHKVEGRSLSPARPKRTRCWNSGPAMARTCGSPACGHAGQDRTSRICGPSLRSRTSPRPRWPPRVMTAASSPSSREP